MEVNVMKKYTCPQCGEEFDKLCGPVNEVDLDVEDETSDQEYFECPECGYRDTKNSFEN